jgi:hypothetical protein
MREEYININIPLEKGRYLFQVKTENDGLILDVFQQIQKERTSYNAIEHEHIATNSITWEELE